MNAAELDDDALLQAVEGCTLPLDAWHHPEHIRIAWCLLRRHPFAEAMEHLRATIKRFNAHHQIPEAIDRGYHETLTRAYLVIIDSTMRHYGPESDSRAFIARHPHLQRTLLRVFYSRERIMSLEAKQGFVEPDLAPLPR
ncbi:MAG TPA: hypothetical protein VG797_00720 [Phycisphaerales bacterium]|nr:hypothetical protein [Phycisphaerales bacterium]